MNSKKLYKAAKAAGFTTFEAQITYVEELSVESFNGEQESFVVAGNGEMNLRGIIDGKCGSFTSDRVDDEVIDAAVAAVKESAAYGQPIDPKYFIKGGEYKYEKVENFSAKLDAVPAERLNELCCRLGKAVHEKDERVNNVGVQLQYVHSKKNHSNSNGLDLNSESNYLMIFASGAVTENGETQSGMHYDFIADLDSFDEGAFVDKLVDKIVKQLGGQTVDSGKYNVVYSNQCVATLLLPICNAFSAFNAEQHISPLEGKIGEKIFDETVTLCEKPIGSSPYCSAYDVEGVPCKNKTLIAKGVPTGYVYDLATADRAGVKSTGNGAMVNGNVRPTLSLAVLEEGGNSLDELFKAVGNGLYITSLDGVHSGMDMKSGAYSLQASGFTIENGVLGRPVSLITAAGNVMEDFKNVIAVGNDSKLTYNGVQAPAVAMSGISISGK